METSATIKKKMLLNPELRSENDPYLHPDLGGNPDPEGRIRWEKAVIKFSILKDKIANPLL